MTNRMTGLLLKDSCYFFAPPVEFGTCDIRFLNVIDNIINFTAKGIKRCDGLALLVR